MNKFYHLLNALKELEDKGIDEYLKTFHKLIRCCGDIIHALHTGKVKVKPYQIYIETLVIRVLYTSSSIYDLIKGGKIESIISKEKIEYIDFATINVLTRSIIESFLTLEYLYFNDEPEEMKEFRYKLWKVSGLISRQSFKTFAERNQEKKAKEKIEIDRLLEEIEAHEQYNTLSRQEKKNLKNRGVPRMQKWSELISNSKVQASYFGDAYSFYSNYAHSEFLSAMQMHQGSYDLNDKENASRIRANVGIINMLICIIIRELKQMFKSSEIIYNRLPSEMQSKIELYFNMATKRN